ncbi:hypothetical protein PC120_g18575 [Phytophthora cactorum]|nr:hypothetical protein PC120_g18575 [Phytophthora cactorum]
MERAASAASNPEADDAPTPVQNPHAHVPPTAEAHSPEDHVPSSTLKTYFVQPMQKQVECGIYEAKDRKQVTLRDVQD